ncbi:SPFH domain-containing protein [Catalinimonas sp. 4WD22]|uniref:SPFH domain-containing protein n=1 Tax=Catalinimonas locisalis TaxID=3133978 RepID=UPI003100CC12
MKQEKEVSALSGYVMAVVAFVLVCVILLAAAITKNPLWIALSIVTIAFFLRGFFMVNPNESRVLVLFGDYVGTVKKNGFFWTNPFYTRQKISLRARNFDSERVKVNDKLGNPIMISVILVWRVQDTYKAAFEVDVFENFVKVQSDAAVRKLAYSYPYDNFNEEDEITLVSGVDEVNEALENQLSDRLKMAGIHVIEARIGYLAYSSEIASAMLRRQQATAIVAAREKIVEGAVSMVEMALEELAQKQIIELDEDKKASMVSNLMVVLCADKDVSPVVNTGTLYQ